MISRLFRGRGGARASDPARGPQPASQGRAAPDDLHRLIYTSEASPPGAAEDGPSPGVREIADDAARRNATCGISGALIAVRGHFIQILEGDRDALETVFERICRDMRHRALTLVDYSPAAERLFSGWDMVSLDASLMDDPEPFEDLFLSIRGGMAPATIVREVRGVLDEVRPHGPAPESRNRSG